MRQPGSDEAVAPRPGRLGALASSSLVRYLAVGLLTFGVDFGLLVINRETFGAPVWLAVSIGFWGSLAVNFFLNRTFTFGGAAPAGRAMFRYACLLGFNYVATVAMVAGAESVGLNYAVAKVAATAAMTLWNYLVYRVWVFV